MNEIKIGFNNKSFQHGTTTTLLIPPPGASCTPDEYRNLLNYLKDLSKCNSISDRNIDEINEQLKTWAINEFFEPDITEN